jgi:hypothetical protein
LAWFWKVLIDVEADEGLQGAVVASVEVHHEVTGADPYLSIHGEGEG